MAVDNNSHYIVLCLFLISRVATIPRHYTSAVLWLSAVDGCNHIQCRKAELQARMEPRIGWATAEYSNKHCFDGEISLTINCTDKKESATRMGRASCFITVPTNIQTSRVQQMIVLHVGVTQSHLPQSIACGRAVRPVLSVPTLPLDWL